jgi:hypothetical protein
MQTADWSEPSLFDLVTNGRLSEVQHQNGGGASPNTPLDPSRTRDPNRCTRDAAAPSKDATHGLHVHRNRGSPCDACRRRGDVYRGDRRDLYLYLHRDPGPTDS